MESGKQPSTCCCGVCELAGACQMNKRVAAHVTSVHNPVTRMTVAESWTTSELRQSGACC